MLSCGYQLTLKIQFNVKSGIAMIAGLVYITGRDKKITLKKRRNLSNIIGHLDSYTHIYILS